jgi:hypothetical protein
MRHVPPVRRIPTKFGHYYKDGAGDRIPGVTTILNAGVPKPQLIDWAGNKSAELAVDNWEELGDMKPLARLDWIKQARKTSENLVKNKGTRVHAIAETVVQGSQATFESDTEEQLIRPHVENYIRFIDQFELDPVLVEVVVVHYDIGYAGTLDLIADITNPHTAERERWLLDLKTGEKGIWPETALQLSAYRSAQFYVDNDGTEQPMLPIDPNKCAAINVTADDALFIPVTADEQAFKVFRYAQKMYEFKKDDDRYVLPPILHPQRSAAKVTWEETA